MSDALAVTVVTAETMAPVEGAVRLTVGRVVSTVTMTAPAVLVLPAPSRAIAVNVCAPLVAGIVFHEIE